jgi:putative acetyltransferase
MTEKPDIEIRDSAPGDIAPLKAVYADAFPDEDLVPLVVALLKTQKDLVVSLVACVGREVVGHILMNICGIEGRNEKAALLGPLGVVSGWQKKGVGSALIAEALRRVKASGAARVLVLGDPAYYGRFGFRADADVAAPYPLPDAWHPAWQSLSLSGRTPKLRGRLVVPEPWRQPALWAPLPE